MFECGASQVALMKPSFLGDHRRRKRRFIGRSLRSYCIVAHQGLTHQSSGQSKGCAFCLPLTSNVRRHRNQRAHHSRQKTAMTQSMQELIEAVERIRDAIRTGSIDQAKRATLLEYSGVLAKGESTGPFPAGEHKEACELVRFHLLRVTLEGIEDRGKVIQRYVIALTVISVIGSVVQSSCAISGDRRAQRQEDRADIERQAKQTPGQAPAIAQSQTIHPTTSPALRASESSPSASAGLK